LLNNFANFVNNYKTNYKIFISFIIKCSKTIITISKVIVSTSLIDIVVSILLLKKHNRLSKTIENPFISKKRNKLFKIKIVTNRKKDNNVRILS